MVSMLLRPHRMNTRSLILTFSALLGACATQPLGDDPAYSTGGGKADGAWCHIAFHSVEGTDIRVDYQIQSKGGTSTNPELVRTASPVWVNVQRDDLGDAHGAHVWIGDEAYTEPGGYDTAVMWNLFQIGPDRQLDLHRSEDKSRFTGEVANGLTLSNYFEGDDQATEHAHQVAVVIDDTWQTDPVSGNHNFVAKTLDIGCN
jgi:hypothetical protein